MAKKSAKSNTVVIVNSDMILYGVFFAFRQAWELLSAAKVLQETGKFPSAYGMAVFCREEVGKSNLLQRLWEKSMAGKPVSAYDLNSGDLRSHTKKLQAAGKVLPVGVGSYGKPPDPGSSEERKSSRLVDKTNAKARELDPDRTHLGRQHGFYVEMHRTGVGWHRPWAAFDSMRSSCEIDEAESACDWRRYELEVLKTNVDRWNVELGNSLYLPRE